MKVKYFWPTSPIGCIPSPWQRDNFTVLPCLSEPNPKLNQNFFFCQTKERWMFSWSSSLSFLLSLLCVHRNALFGAEIKETKDTIDKIDSVPIRVCVCVWLCESGIAITWVFLHLCACVCVCNCRRTCVILYACMCVCVWDDWKEKREDGREDGREKEICDKRPSLVFWSEE